MRLGRLPAIGTHETLSRQELVAARSRIHHAMLAIERKSVMERGRLPPRYHKQLVRVLASWREYGLTLSFETQTGRSVASVSYGEYIRDFNQLEAELCRLLSPKMIKVPPPATVVGPPPLPARDTTPPPPNYPPVSSALPSEPDRPQSEIETLEVPTVSTSTHRFVIGVMLGVVAVAVATAIYVALT